MLVFVIPACAEKSAAQTNQLKFRRPNAERELSQATARCILQDRKGFLWIGTQDGLNKYDGYTYTVYRHEQGNPQSLSNNSVSAIYEDKFGTLWIGTTGGGLNKLDRGSDKFTGFQFDSNNPNSLSDNNITFIHGDDSGMLWIGTELGGLNGYNLETEKFTRYQHNPANPRSLSDNTLKSIFEDESGNIWIGTGYSGLEKFDSATGEFIHYKVLGDKYGLNYPIMTIYGDKRGSLWLGSEGGGLDKFNPQTGEFVNYRHNANDKASLSDDTVRVIYEDSLGDLWIGTKNGLNKFNSQNSTFFQYYSDPQKSNSLSGSSVSALFEDECGILWIGTEGISKLNLRDKPFAIYKNDADDPHSLSNDTVFAFFEDDSGGLWIGTAGGGLNFFDRGTKQFTRYRHEASNPNSLSDDFVYAINEDASGAIWVGTSGGGLNRLDRATGKFTNFRHDASNPKSLSDDKVWAISNDRNGALWIGTQNGLNKFDLQTEEFTRFQHDSNNPQSLSNNDVRTILQDASGAIWIGTRHGGLDKFDFETGKFEHYRHDEEDPNSLSSNAVYFLHEDNSGTLWVGTTEGVNRFEPSRNGFTHFGEKDGLPNNTVYGILSDKTGNLWISTNKGIAKFNAQTRTSRNYTADDGLQDNEFNGAAAFQSADGTMFFGGIGGFNSFYPEQIIDSDYKPPIVLKAFKKFDREIELNKSPDEIDEVELSYEDNVFSIEFAALDFTAPQKNQYAYKLEGFDADWNYIGTRHAAYYTNLDGGDYVFRVRGTNSDGVWSDKEATVKIKIIPPFWETWWFSTLVVCTVIGLAFLIYNRRISYFSKARAMQEAFSQQLIESQEAERKRIAVELHDGIGQSLVVIKNRALMGLNAPENHDRLLTQIEGISEAASAAIHEVRDIARNLHPYQIEYLGLTSALKTMIESISKASDIKFIADIDEFDGELSREAEINLYRIVQEALNNIVKHSKASAAEIILKKNEQIIDLTIKDNGTGFSYSSENRTPGLGLIGMSERSKMINARQEIVSTPEQGTTIRLQINLPYKKNEN